MLEILKAVGLHVTAIFLKLVFHSNHTKSRRWLLTILKYTLRYSTMWTICLGLTFLTGVVSFKLFCFNQHAFLSYVMLGVFSSFLVTTMVTFVSVYDKIERRGIELSGYYHRLQVYKDYYNVLHKHNDDIEIVWYLLPHLMPLIYEWYKMHSEYFFAEESKCLQIINEEYTNILCNIRENIRTNSTNGNFKSEDDILGKMAYAKAYNICLTTYRKLHRGLDCFSGEECSQSVWLSEYCYKIFKNLEYLCIFADIE